MIKIILCSIAWFALGVAFEIAREAKRKANEKPTEIDIEIALKKDGTIEVKTSRGVVIGEVEVKDHGEEERKRRSDRISWN